MAVFHQCKIFVNYSHEIVEEEANKWLRANSHIAVFDITYSKHRTGEHTIFVTYDPMESDE